MQSQEIADVMGLSFADSLELDVSSIQKMSGGVVSRVYSVHSANHGLIAVKITKDPPATYKELDSNLPFTRRDYQRLLKPAPRTHHLDYLLLKELARQGINVPEVLAYDQENRGTAMRHFGEDGYELAQNLFVAGQITTEQFGAIGSSIACLVKKMQQLDKARFVPIESPDDQFEERFEEFARYIYKPNDKYPGISARAKQVIADAMKGDKLIPTDGHLKNIGLTQDNKVIHIDFGRTIVGSIDYPAPNFAAHIVLGIHAETIPVKAGLEALDAFIQEYERRMPINPETFPLFLVAEELHRASGRWLDPHIMRVDGEVCEARAHRVANEIVYQKNPDTGFLINSITKSMSLT